MSVSLADIRDNMMLAFAGIAGAVLVPVVPVVGFPLCAAALASFVYRGRYAAAALVAGFAICIAGILRFPDVVVLAPAIAVLLIATVRLRDTDAVSVVLALVPVFAILFALGEFANAWLLGLSYREYLTEGAEMFAPMVTDLSDLGVVTADTLVDGMIQFAPAGYLLLALVTVVPTVAAIIWVARRVGVSLQRVPQLDKLDLSPHVLWLPVGALSCMAAGRFLGSPEGTVMVIGLNLLIAAKIVLLVQGLGVLASWLRRAGVGRVGRMVAYVGAVLIDGPTWIVSMIGLMDFWADFRKLREASEDDLKLEGPTPKV